MSKEFARRALEITENFVPAEQAQSSAAEQAARSYLLAIEVRRAHPREAAATEAAMASLSRGLAAAAEADIHLRDAHRRFVAFALREDIRADGWGCTSPDCVDLQPTTNVLPIDAGERHAA